jgi:hypothetical protein
MMHCPLTALLHTLLDVSPKGILKFSKKNFLESAHSLPSPPKYLMLFINYSHLNLKEGYT